MTLIKQIAAIIAKNRADCANELWKKRGIGTSFPDTINPMDTRAAEAIVKWMESTPINER